MNCHVMKVMSQEEVYKIIKEFGGEATTKEIRQRAKEKFPRFSLHQYVSIRLRQLERKGYIKRIYDEKYNKIRCWKIVEEYP